MNESYYNLFSSLRHDPLLQQPTPRRWRIHKFEGGAAQGAEPAVTAYSSFDAIFDDGSDSAMRVMGDLQIGKSVIILSLHRSESFGGAMQYSKIELRRIGDESKRWRAKSPKAYFERREYQKIRELLKCGGVLDFEAELTFADGTKGRVKFSIDTDGLDAVLEQIAWNFYL